METITINLTTMKDSFLLPEEVLLKFMSKNDSSFLLGNIQNAKEYLADSNDQHNSPLSNKSAIFCNSIKLNRNDKFLTLEFEFNLEQLNEVLKKTNLTLDNIINCSIITPIGIASMLSLNDIRKHEEIRLMQIEQLNGFDILVFDTIEDKNNWVKENHQELHKSIIYRKF